jgi:sucrose phosphorylase
MPGIPAVYFNSLMGTPNWTEGVDCEGGYNRAINRRKWTREDLDAKLDEPDGDRAAVFAAYMKMLRRRRDHTAFHPAAPMQVHELGPDYFCFTRTAIDGQESIICLFNLTARERKIPIARLEELGLPQEGSARDIHSASTLRMGPNRNITLAPYQAAWLVIR